MRILLDNGVPRGVSNGLPDHTVDECRSYGWDTLLNGELLDAAEAAGFDVLLTTDRNIRVSPIVIDWRPPVLGREYAPASRTSAG